MRHARQGCLFVDGVLGKSLFHLFEQDGELMWPAVCRYCDSTEDQNGYITESEKLKAARDLDQLVEELKNG